MMKVVRFVIPVLVLIFLAAYLGYILGGHNRQLKVERQFEIINYSSYATHINVNGHLLSLIEAKKYKEANDLLENLIDVDLASLSLYDKLASRYPCQNIFDAIATVKNRRAAHPGHKVNKKLLYDVERAFNISN
jgi:hypothetical protein